MKIILRSIPHSGQTYPTAGNYFERPDGTLEIVVSDTGNEDYNVLIALHELVEARLMQKRGIPLRDSDTFDIEFEKQRELGAHSQTDEPGNDPRCPYRREHFTADVVERIVAHELGVDWKLYGDAVNAL
jgi:hypothetical protein